MQHLMAKMDSVAKGNENDDASELFQAQSRVWNQMFGFVSSASLKCAVQLGIPDVIREHGWPMAVPELARALRVPQEKSHGLFRLMRFLGNSGFFEIVRPEGDGEPSYALNRLSELLLRDNPFSMFPMVLTILDPLVVNPFDYYSAWFLNDKATPFGMAFGVEFWENISRNSSWSGLFNEGMASDTRFVSSVLVDGPGKEIFEGIDSLVDVGGGTGTFARAIADAFPNVECTVLDLPHVVGSLEGCNNLRYVQGDMFEMVPPADAVLLKWILHDWGDNDCVKILKRCRESISQRRNKGKVIIIDMVVGNAKADEKMVETQLCFDMMMMALFSGKERKETEWAKLFSDAGFSGWLFLPFKTIKSQLLCDVAMMDLVSGKDRTEAEWEKLFSDAGLRSLIEVYP